MVVLILTINIALAPTPATSACQQQVLQANFSWILSDEYEDMLRIELASVIMLLARVN